MPSVALPVFHPDHPHNRQPNTPLGAAYDTNVPLPVRRSRYPTAAPPSAFKSPGGMSDSDASVGGSPNVNRRCFCGNQVVDGGIYCSIDCARSDAFTSLCYKSGPSTSTSGSLPNLNLPPSRQPVYDETLSAPLSRQPSSSTSTISSLSDAEASNVPEWNASHYRRMARADSRRDERREERRRRRAEGSVASSSISRTSTASSSRVPELVGGYNGHSRNGSTASTMSTSSGWSGSTLSRNVSSASNISSASRRYRGDKVGVIQEDDDEEETLDTRPYPIPNRGGASLDMGGLGHKRGRSSHSKKKIADPMGMGKDMRDILEEIISMEKSFILEDEPTLPDSTSAPIFTAVFDRPPRTPSPVGHTRQKSIAPNAPIRGHRSSLSLSHHPSGLVPPPPQHPTRPTSSMMGLHQSSLSESHTALYLATASPMAPSRRSASPMLHSRNSLTFTPQAAGPAITSAGLMGKFDSPNVSTPSRRRPGVSPTASYGTMDGWRFPGSGTGFGGITTPRGPQPTSAPIPSNNIPPHLLWPSQPLFPQSPGIDTPQFLSALHARPNSLLNTSGDNANSGPSDFHPPQSGLRLGVLLGSGEDGEDVEMDVDEDDESTAHGHGHDVFNGGGGEYLPVFLEAEGFRQANNGWGM